MNRLLDEINDIYNQLGESKLSDALSRIIPIALECEDYEGFVILSMWEIPLAKNRETNVAHYKSIQDTLENAGLSTSDAEGVLNNAQQKYVKSRTDEKGFVATYTAKQLENTLDRADALLKVATVPEGLNPVDKYYLNKEMQNTAIGVLENRQAIEDQYSFLRGVISNKLANYRQIALKQQRTDMESRNINSKDIFIIHGHNEAKRRELCDLLKVMNLNPIVLSEQPSQGLTIIEKFEKYAATCAYAFALFTPDDIVVNDNGDSYFQARPNVIFELGWFYAALGRARVCILDQVSEKSMIFSDLQGVMRIQFKDSISEEYLRIKGELQSVGVIS